MQFARPPRGFKIVIDDSIQDTVNSFINTKEAYRRCWEGIIERLRMSAHKDGQPYTSIGKGCRVFSTGPDLEAGTPRVMLGYLVLGETVKILVLKVN